MDIDESMFKNFLDITREKDSIQIEKIINKLEKYNKSEFLKRISALRLCFENRDKAVLIDAVTTEMLRWLHKNNWNFNGISMSYGKFKNIINLINQLGTKSAIDPLDNPYVDDVQFYGNYKVIPGINQNSSYNLSILIKTIFFTGKTQLPEDVKQDIVDTLSFYLNISTFVCDSVVLSNELKFDRQVFIPDKNRVDNYMKYISYERGNKQFERLLISKSDFNLYENKSFSQEGHSFLTKPFIETDNEIILLDVTSISNALCSFLNDKVSSAFIFDEVWNDIKNSLKNLGHFKVKTDDFKISLLDEINYKESIFSVANNKLLLGFGLFNGNQENIDFSEKLSDRITKIVSGLNLSGIKHNQLFILIVAHTFGSQVSASIKTKNIPIAQFSATEIKAISEVEVDSLFIPRFMLAKNKSIVPGGFGDFMSAIVFSQNDMSFYAGDDIDYREMETFVAIEETSDYYLKALNKQRKKVFQSLYDSNWYTGTKEEFGNRYFVNMSKSKELKCFVETKNNKLIEIVTEKINQPEILDIYFNFLDTISYWLDKYYLNKTILNNNIIYLHIEKVDIESYFISTNEFLDSKEIKIFRKNKGQLHCEISVDTYKNMGMSNTNYYEKEVLRDIIQKISGSVDDEYLESMFSPVFKKKMTGLVLDNNGKLRIPTSGFNLLTISEYEINVLLDELGEYLKERKYEYGEIPKKANVQFCNDIVGYLYSVLEKEVSIFNKNQLIKVLVSQIETLLPLQLRDEASYNNDISLSPFEKEYFFKKLDENNRCSLATKFLLEYVVATPIMGQDNVGIWEIERLLAICSLIIEWAHRSDYFNYKLVDTTINFLQSNRIGLNKKDFKDVNNAMLSSRNDQLTSYNRSRTKVTSHTKIIDSLLNNKLNSAFQEAFNFTYNEYDTIISALIDAFDDLNKIVWIVDKSVTIDKIFKEVKEVISKRQIFTILNFVTLEERSAYLTPPKGYKGIDIFPWVFNRPLSFIRRPIVIYEDKYIFGIRNIIHSRKYLLHLIWQGKLKTKSKLMKDLMSKLRNIEGNIFNEQVEQKIKKYSELEVMKGVSKVGNKHISDENNSTLGDIDVYVINRSKKKMYLIETKDFSFSRNPYEIAMEQKKIFYGENPFVVRHLRRRDWVEENLDYILEYYKLEGNTWKIVPMFVVSQYLISKDLIANYDVEFYSEAQLSDKVFS